MVRIRHFRAPHFIYRPKCEHFPVVVSHLGWKHSRKALYNIGFYIHYLCCFPFQSLLFPALVSGRNCAGMGWGESQNHPQPRGSYQDTNPAWKATGIFEKPPGKGWTKSPSHSSPHKEATSEGICSHTRQTLTKIHILIPFQHHALLHSSVFRVFVVFLELSHTYQRCTSSGLAHIPALTWKTFQTSHRQAHEHK